MEDTAVLFVERLITMINDLTVVPFAVPLIVLLVSVFKRFVPAQWASSNTLHFVVQVVFWLGFAVFGKLGGDLPAFEEWTVNITKLLEVAVPLLLPFLVSLFGGHAAYTAARNRGITGFGYQRAEGPANLPTLPKWLSRAREVTTEPKG